jgi:hypothetical protein
LPFRYRTNEYLALITGSKNIIDRPRELPFRHGRRLRTLDIKLHHVLGHQQQTVFEQTDANTMAGVGLMPFKQSAEDGERTKQTAHNVIGGGTDAQGPPAGPGHVGHARHHLHDFVHGGAVFVRPMQKPLA